jgi:nitrite reductase (NADH) large subunit
MPQPLLVVGNGMAGLRFVEALLRLAPGRFAVTVVGAEPQPAYNRVLLSALLAQDVSAAELTLRDRAWYAENGVRLVTGDAIAAVDGETREARLASGEAIPFAHCVFATGSHPVRLPLPGMDKAGVIAFRDFADVAAMERAAAAGARIAVIGGGLLGIEAAYGLARRGAPVTLVHAMDRLMERQLDAPAAALVARALARRGVKVLLDRRTVAVTGEAAADGLVFADGERLAADLVVCAVGIRPNADLARAAGLAVNRGIVVDDRMAASLAGFHAIGECAEHRGTAYGLVEPAHAQAEALARRLAGLPAAFEGMVPATNLKVSGLPVFSAGRHLGGEGVQCATLTDTRAGTYRKLVFEASGQGTCVLSGCVLVGDADDALWYLDLMRRGVDVAPARALLIHGRDFAEPALEAALPRAA